MPHASHRTPRSRRAAWLTLLLPLASASASTGGPSAAGFVYTDSLDPGGPTPAWLDATWGDALVLGDDDSAVVDLPFAFTVDGVPYSTATVSSNGVLYFAGTGPDGTTTDPVGACPDETAFTGVAVFADDLAASTVYTATYGRYPHRTFVISWESFQPVGSPDTGRAQAWLLEGRDEVVIDLDDLDFGDPAHDGGVDAFIGLSVGSGGGAEGLAYACEVATPDGTTAWLGPGASRTARSVVRSDELDDPWVGDADFAYAGTSVAAGDANGDGVDDSLVGAKDRLTGRVYLAYRPNTAESFDASPVTFNGQASFDGFGTAVLLEDLDGDGLGDVTIGAPANDDAGTNQGKVYTWLGGEWDGALDASSADVNIAGDGSDRPSAGSSLAGAQDVNGDGYNDLVIGEPDSDLGASNSGSVALFYGPLPYGEPAADATFSSSLASDHFGTRVATVDLDGDGAAEIIASSPQDDAGGADAGAVYVFEGGAWSGSADPVTDAACTWTGTTASDRFGSSLLGADIDGSGLADLVAGAPLGNGSGSDAGYAWVLYDPGLTGCATTTALADASVNGTTASANLGSQLAAGDIDGDGVDDLVVTAPNAVTDTSGGGKAYVFTTAPVGAVLASTADHTVLGESTGGALGTSVAIAQDEDDWPTLLTTAPYANGVYTAQGAMYAWAYSPEFLDADGDGFVDQGLGGNDCADDDADAYPGGTDADGDSVDGDCDGWTDGVILVRDTEGGFDYDLVDLGCFDCDGAPHVFDFESYGVGDVVGDYTVDGTTLSVSPRAYAQDEVLGTWPGDTRALQFVPDSVGTLTLSFSTPVDAISWQLLDANDAFLLTATGDEGTISFNFTESADNRSGGVFHGYGFAFAVDTITLRPLTGDGFGLDTLGVLYAADTDRDGDGYTESDVPADCDDTRADVNPDAVELLDDEVDNNCDGITDAGGVNVYDDEATWQAAANVATPQHLDFEVVGEGESVERQYVDLGALFEPGSTGAGDVDGTPAHDTRGAVESGDTLTMYFQEPQPGVGLTLLDADGTFTVEGWYAGQLEYTSVVTATGPDVFVGFDYDYQVDEVRIIPPSSGEVYGIDDVVYSALGLDDADGDGQTESEGDCDDANGDAYGGAEEVPYDDVDEDCSDDDADPTNDDDDDADGDGYPAVSQGGSDCDDAASSVNPDADDPYYDGEDSNCDGSNDFDADNDGVVSQDWGGTDCDDADSDVNPDVEETYYDGVDSNCDEADDYDADGDGYPSSAGGGSDCNDSNAAANPDAEEIPYDGIDEDCSGSSEIDDYDVDGDGYTSDNYGGTDCVDDDAGAYPHAPGEACYDGVDTDCDGASDYDCDSDGYDEELYGGDDCDDSDPAVNPAAADTRGDGVDSNCDDGPEFDFDNDGYDAIADGGADCDDGDAAVSPAALDACYDGLDADCSGNDDFDCDGDDDPSDLYGGADCADADPEISSLREDFPYDGTDMDCDGSDEYDVDGDGDASSWYGGTDCDDTDATILPGAPDACYDGVDSDCDSTYSDDDCDHDGYDVSVDCDESDAAVHPGAIDLPDDGIDQDCDGSENASCTDCDGDGHDATPYGGDDCDDADPAAYTGAAETWYDGVDEACDGGDDYDADGDGADAEAWGGGDCDDANPDASPLNPGDPCYGGDEDCDGETDEDCGGDDTGGDSGDSADTDADTDTDTDADTDADSDADSDTDTDTGEWLPSGDSAGAEITVTPTGPTCGCSSGGGSAGWAALLVAGLATRRRRA